MSIYEIPHKFIAGTKAVAAEVNENFEYVLDSLEEAENGFNNEITTVKSDIFNLQNQEGDLIIRLGDITTQGTIPLSADRISSANITVASEIILPDLTNSDKFINTMLEFTLSTDVTLELPTNVIFAGGEPPQIVADGVTINRLIFDTTTGGNTWMCYFNSNSGQ